MYDLLLSIFPPLISTKHDIKYSQQVIEVDPKTNRVRVQLTVVPEPDLISLMLNKKNYSENYIPAHVMAKRLGLSSQALAQITGKVLLATSDKEK